VDHFPQGLGENLTNLTKSLTPPTCFDPSTILFHLTHTPLSQLTSTWALLDLDIWPEFLDREPVQTFGTKQLYEIGAYRKLKTPKFYIRLVVSTHLKNISQIGNCCQMGLKIKNIWNHHLDIIWFSHIVPLHSLLQEFFPERLALSQGFAHNYVYSWPPGLFWIHTWIMCTVYRTPSFVSLHCHVTD